MIQPIVIFPPSAEYASTIQLDARRSLAPGNIFGGFHVTWSQASGPAVALSANEGTTIQCVLPAAGTGPVVLTATVQRKDTKEEASVNCSIALQTQPFSTDDLTLSTDIPDEFRLMPGGSWDFILTLQGEQDILTALDPTRLRLFFNHGVLQHEIPIIVYVEQLDRWRINVPASARGRDRYKIVRSQVRLEENSQTLFKEATLPQPAVRVSKAWALLKNNAAIPIPRPHIKYDNGMSTLILLQDPGIDVAMIEVEYLIKSIEEQSGWYPQAGLDEWSEIRGQLSLIYGDGVDYSSGDHIVEPPIWASENIALSAMTRMNLAYDVWVPDDNSALLRENYDGVQLQ